MLDDVYYKALREICNAIGEIVWSGKENDYLKKSSTPWMCVSIENTRNLPSSVILPISKSMEEVEIFLEYKGIPFQCNGCLELGHAEENCLNPKTQKMPTQGKDTDRNKRNPPKQKPHHNPNTLDSKRNQLPKSQPNANAVAGQQN